MRYVAAADVVRMHRVAMLLHVAYLHVGQDCVRDGEGENLQLVLSNIFQNQRGKVALRDVTQGTIDNNDGKIDPSIVPCGRISNEASLRIKDIP